jgi:hypothetical protein
MMDFAAFAHDIEAAYRGVWQAWCADRPDQGVLNGDASGLADYAAGE